jgi:hypothetical protein
MISFFKSIFLKIKQKKCKHVNIDLIKLGYQRCIFCEKESKKAGF